jgi:hypothetical protein
MLLGKNVNFLQETPEVDEEEIALLEKRMQLAKVRGVIQNKLQTAHNSKTIENSKKYVKAKVVHKNILSNFCFYDICLK